jgi:hypothetical protein
MHNALVIILFPALIILELFLLLGRLDKTNLLWPGTFDPLVFLFLKELD